MALSRTANGPLTAPGQRRKRVIQQSVCCSSGSSVRSKRQMRTVRWRSVARERARSSGCSCSEQARWSPRITWSISSGARIRRRRRGRLSRTAWLSCASCLVPNPCSGGRPGTCSESTTPGSTWRGSSCWSGVEERRGGRAGCKAARGARALARTTAGRSRVRSVRPERHPSARRAPPRGVGGTDRGRPGAWTERGARRRGRRARRRAPAARAPSRSPDARPVRGGRQAEALEIYHELRRALSDELGIDLSPALQRLYAANPAAGRGASTPAPERLVGRGPPRRRGAGACSAARARGGPRRSGSSPAGWRSTRRRARSPNIWQRASTALPSIAAISPTSRNAAALVHGVGPLYDELHDLFDRDYAPGGAAHTAACPVGGAPCASATLRAS